MRFSLRLTRLARLTAACGLAACGRTDQSPVDTVSVRQPVGVRAPAPGDPSCPRTGLWQACALVDRIVHAGLSFKFAGDSVRVPFLSVPGVRYRVAVTDTMLAFFFADSTAMAKALVPLDTLRMAPRADSLSPWPSTPTVIRSANLLALYFGTSERQIERVRLAITAGAPAPVRERP